MARDPRAGGALLVELKAVDAGYPLYGRLDTTPAARRSTRCSAERTASSWSRRRCSPGSASRSATRSLIGDARFTVTGVLRRSPTARPRSVTLGPRVL